MNGTENCTFSNPIRYDGSTPTLPTHAFYFRNKTCTFTGSSSVPTVTLNAFNPTTTISTSSNVTVYGFMSAGEVLIALFLFILIWIKLLSFIPAGLSRVKTKKTFLAYGKGDVELRDDY